jgi:hypothetical protein
MHPYILYLHVNCYMAVPIQMRYSITSQGVGARHCRALTGIPHGNENRYISHLT